MSRLLDPGILMAIKELSLAAKTTIEGFMNGINRSMVKGTGMEFSQYRSYQPGDDLRSLDWKMFARSDRYYIRESEVETTIGLRLIVDASASMNHEDGPFKKIEYARYLAASLAYLANLQGDATGLDVLMEDRTISLPVTHEFQQLARIIYQLEQLAPGGKFTAASARQSFSRSARRELVIVITDFYQQDQEIFDLLENLNIARHEVILFHLMARNELEMSFGDYTAFEDLESGQVVEIDQAALRSTYLSRLNAYLEKVKTTAWDRKMHYRLLCTDEPLEEALTLFLKERKKIIL